MAISAVPGVERHKKLGKGKQRLRERSILHCETRSVGYLLPIDLMMLEKHLSRLLNGGCKSCVKGSYSFAISVVLDFFVTLRLRRS